MNEEQPTPCPDPWHTDPEAPHDTYTIEAPGGWSMEGYACRTCGFRTIEID